MDRIEKFAIIGLGAIGSSYLSRALETIGPKNARVIAGGQRAPRYKSDGVFVNGKKLTFAVYDPDDTPEPADLIFFTVKNNELRQAILDAKNQIGPETIIMPLLNGITSERIISETYGSERVLYSIAIGIDATRTGNATVNSTLGAIQFGEAVNIKGSYSKNVLLVKEFFDRVRIPYEIHEDMKYILWKKFMLNVGANQTSAVLRLGYGAMRKTPEARDIVVSAMREVLALAPYENVKLSETDIDDCLKRLDSLSPSGKTSMLQDVEAGRRTEADLFGGTVIGMARARGVNVPVNEFLFKCIRAIEKSYMQ